MTANQGRDREKSRRDREMYRVEAIRTEMASSVRFLGGAGPALTQNNRAARVTRLPVTVIERLRWLKMKRIPADIADSVREAVAKHNEEGLSRAKHELEIERARNAALLAYFEASDPDFYRAEIARLRRSPVGLGSPADLQSRE